MWKSSLTERARVAGVVCSRVAATHTDSSGCFIHDRMLTLNNSYYHHGWRLHSLAASHNVIHQVIHEGAVTVVDDDHIERRDVLAPQLANLSIRNHALYDMSFTGGPKHVHQPQPRTRSFRNPTVMMVSVSMPGDESRR